MTSSPDFFDLAPQTGLPQPLDVRRIEVADVWKMNRRAGTLSRGAVGTTFDYDAEYLAAPGPAVATTLKLSDQPVLTMAGAVPAFFAGLLPEGRRLTALRSTIKTSADDELSLVLAVGADPVGDVQILPAGAAPYVPLPSLSWASGMDVRFSEILEDAQILNRRALAGVQDKASAAMITLPGRWSGHDAIVKFSPPEYPHLVENEAWFLDLAASAGLPTPRHRIIRDRAGTRALVIERFDRHGPSQCPTRDAVEDGTQVLGLYPADKYRVTAEQVTTALLAHCQAPVVAARDAFRLFLFAWLTGNGDLHAKNISIIQRDGEWRLAPIYDTPSTLPYGDDAMALSMAGRDSDLSRKAFLEFARTIELPTPAAQSAITSMLRATEPVLAVFADRHEPFTQTRSADALAAIRYRRRMLAD
ncbi:MAG: type II toxin-antitoxin system HipA family toxin [Actinomycetales bacterium]